MQISKTLNLTSFIVVLNKMEKQFRNFVPRNKPTFRIFVAYKMPVQTFHDFNIHKVYSKS